MSSPAAGLVSSPIIYGKVDFGPTFGEVYRPVNNERIVTAAGDVTVERFDQLIVVKKTVAEVTEIFLPAVSTWLRNPWGGFPIVIKDGNGDSSNFPITVTPSGSDTIDGLAQFVIQGNGAIIYLRPLTDFSGWITL